MKKIFHIMILDKFIPPFIDFVSNNFNVRQHYFFILGKPQYKYGLSKEHPVKWIDDEQKLIFLFRKLQKADKIILHGLWSEEVNKLLYFRPEFLEKCYWVMWGGDFYFPERHSDVKKKLIKRIRHFVTYLKADYEYVKQYYGAEGEFHECLVYPSNVFRQIVKSENLRSGSEELNILVGNSATPENNHIWIFDKIKKLGTKKIFNVYVPLSYGDFRYANYVISEGTKLFGNRFYPLMDFIPYEEYLRFLFTIDIALFAHDRQQAMGNTIALLGMGKKVFMKRGTSQWRLFNELGIRIFDIKDLSDKHLKKECMSSNIEKVATYFSEENLKRQLKLLFE
ncbi:4-alpha-L-fucosyltransferase glycosyl transferase group 56 [Desulfurobacterium pacificum]|uniref:4-alpha-L-fucosyltransferase glycosyl transferase group 56 n=1 Tax=Desulfurobacterium pacificum TaxID=240166 RepID=A0ABY1NE91_9BACT|nr:TDP-N-acetylfucosamine:lipid II N-acetylfucosaminyltransferase [Desulfurobacterium pacificum]SMP07005.1 4-alpha-L-fucosyltransferase glycosyl transferase group 56 [Desulfurobacterium pacificum]